MQLIATSLLFLSVMLFYIVSKRIEANIDSALQTFSDRPLLSRIIGAVLATAGLVLMVITLGKATGFFVALAIWMTFASVIILFAPFNKIKPLYAVVFALILMALGIFI